MKQLCAQAPGFIDTDLGIDARSGVQVNESNHEIERVEEISSTSGNRAAPWLRFWIIGLLAGILVVSSSGLALPKDTGAIGKPGSTAAMKAEMRSIPEMTVAFIHGTRPAKGCGPDWDRLMAWAKKKGLLRKNTVYAGVSYDDPSTTPPGRARYDACITVPKRTKGDGDVKIGQIAGRDYAVFVHRGPYRNLKVTYASIYGMWAPNTNRKVAHHPALEIYKTPSRETPPEKLLTEICIPLTE